jgi:hypothetical protein
VASVVLCWLRSRQHPWSSSASGRSNTALPLARPICRFCRSVPPGSLAFADSVTDCGYSRDLPTLRACQVFHPQDTRRYGSTPVPALCSERYFPGLTPSEPPRESMKNERPIRRAARKKVACLSGGCFVRFMSDRFRVPAARSDPGYCFGFPSIDNSPGTSRTAFAASPLAHADACRSPATGGRSRDDNSCSAGA